ncbi:MAG: flavodoxin family protein [Bacillota bacterium]
MSIVILDAMVNDTAVSNIAKEIMGELRGEKTLFNLKDMNILPCRSCGGCSFKSPGKCVVQDEMHGIMGAIAKCHTIIMVTPIRFGGYPSILKKAVDKFMNLCLPTYTVQDGHLLHPPRYGNKALIVIGISNGKREQEISFTKLVENNALNLQYASKAVILKETDDLEAIKERISNVLKEVC